MALPAVIEPCLPSPGERPPTERGWVHEIKHDGYRLMARRDPVGIRLITRRGNDWTPRVTDRYRLSIAILIVSSGAIGLPLPDHVGAEANSCRGMSNAASCRPRMTTTSIGTATSREPKLNQVRANHPALHQPDLALRGTHHLADIAYRKIIVVKQRKPDQIADLDRLREAHVHFLFR